MITRKNFLKHASVLAAGSLLPLNISGDLFNRFNGQKITILYTNDTHARLDPFPENARRFAGLGGIARRASLVKKVRAQEKNVLLLDGGDVFQGTPWFDVYGGKVDLELMTEMQYDAMVVGNHEFDRGLEGFAEAAQKAGFPILASNYLTRNTPMHPHVQRQIIKEFDGFRIGIFGLGIQFNGVVDPKLYGEVISQDPVSVARRGVESLRNFHYCDYVICLSHLGFQYQNGRIDDITLATSVEGIDLIIGGHTHTFLDEPVIIENPSGKKTTITHMGHSGVRVGRIDIDISGIGQYTAIQSRYYIIDGQS
ncbi:MAG: bifunctional metallophosphatase/5'-nucleotidase [Balneolaceae bacterium]|nr:MAG: bifunctional metallophosphatase/5'-nucleotidase [Balneolaceae bacterium]